MKTKIKLLIALGIVSVVLNFLIFFLPKIIGDTVYPLRYKTEIKKYASTYKVNPNLIAGLIYVESGFNTYATSPVGARGLMQVMPATGAGIARQIGEKNFTFASLYDPRTSIKFGCYYMKQLLTKYNNNPYFALTAYNGGPAAGDYYATYGHKGGLSMETQSYAGKVMRAKAVYDDVYGEWWDDKKVEAKKKENVKPLAFLKNLLRPEPSLIDMVITWLLPR